MPKVVVEFERCVQDSQDFGSNDEHMVSRVFFTLHVDGKAYTGLTADVKQAVGANYATDPLEVGSPKGYKGPFDWQAFQKCVEGYYRSLIGGSGSGIRMQGAANLRMRNNQFVQRSSCEFQAEESGTAWG